MDMLNNLRDLLTVKNIPIINAESLPGNCSINPLAAAELLAHFHQNWEEIHKNNENNAKLAIETSEVIEKLHAYITLQNDSILAINQLLLSMPSLQTIIQTCNEQMKQLCKSFDQIEKDLIDFEELIDQEQLEQKKNNHRFQLALYEEKKINNLDILRKELGQKHEQNIIDHDIKKKQAMHERQQVFQDAFKTDLETYKALGTIPKIQVKNHSSALLEEIHLDIDDKELMDFLEEESGT